MGSVKIVPVVRWVKRDGTYTLQQFIERGRDGLRGEWEDVPFVEPEGHSPGVRLTTSDEIKLVSSLRVELKEKMGVIDGLGIQVKLLRDQRDKALAKLGSTERALEYVNAEKDRALNLVERLESEVKGADAAAKFQRQEKEEALAQLGSRDRYISDLRKERSDLKASLGEKKCQVRPVNLADVKTGALGRELVERLVKAENGEG